eukprot:m.237694 g.237694  ORF g.237694 m.237694 type:complete len:311 (-) comp10910_c0_seq1:225-1157(-)
MPVDQRTCKHLREYLGDAYETARCGGAGGASAAPRARALPRPGLLLAHKYADTMDPTNWWISEKLDGVRAFWNGKEFVSRLGNAFPAPAWFIDPLPKHTTLDGELFVGRSQFSSTVSIVKTSGSSRWSSVTYQIFDIPSLGTSPFEDRITEIKSIVSAASAAHICAVEHSKCTGREHLADELDKVHKAGGEGLMLRQPRSKYFEGRSSTLLKVKTFYDAEAEVIAHVPGKGKYAAMCGSLELRMACGKTFRAGSGMSDRDREHPPAIGSIVSYRFQELTGDGVPRFPTYVGVRIDVDRPKDAVIRAVTSD